MTDQVRVLLRVARRVSDGEVLTMEMLDAEGVEIDLRLLVAGVALVASGRRADVVSLTNAAMVARPTAHRDHEELLDELEHQLPALVEGCLSTVEVALPSVSLQRQLDVARRAIADERARRLEVEAQLAQVSSYAHELHGQLRDQREDAIRDASGDSDLTP